MEKHQYPSSDIEFTITNTPISLTSPSSPSLSSSICCLPSNNISPTDTSTTTTTNITSTTTLNSSASSLQPCQSCRKLHRKCDKLLPSCSYCIKRGYICSYQTNEKTKNNNQEQSMIPNRKKQSSPSSSTISVNNHHHNNNSNNYRSVPYPSPSSSSTAHSVNTINSGITNFTTPHHDNSNYPECNFNPMITNPSNSTFLNISNILNQQLQMNYRLITNQTLDIYYQYLCNGFPMVDRRILERVLDFHSLSGGDYSISNRFSQTMLNQTFQNVSEFEKDQCLLYSLQAMCLQQLGNREASNQLYSNARQLIGKYFDEVFDSQSIMIAMTFMGMYLVGEGENKKAKSILSSVKSAIDPYKNPESASAAQHDSSNSNTAISTSVMPKFSLPGMKEASAEAVVEDDNAISEWVNTQPKCFTSFLIDTQLRALGAYFGEEENPTTYILDGLEVLGNNNIKLTKLRELIPDCRILNREAIDSLLSLLPAMECLANVVLTNFNRMPSLKLMYAFFFKQFRLDILKNAEESIRDVPQMLCIARQVIELTKDELFPFLTIVASKPIIMAASLRVHYFNKLGPNDNVNDDLRALKILSKNFKAIQTSCTPLIKALESLMYLQQCKAKLSGIDCSFLDFGEDVFSIESLSNSSSPSSAHSTDWLTPQIIFDSYESQYAPLFKNFGVDTEMIDVFIGNLSEQEKLYNGDKTKLKEKRIELVEKFKTVSGKKKDVFGVVASEFLKKQLETIL